MTNPGRAYEHIQRRLTDQERGALRESLQTHGLRDEIILDQHNDILDGYNREDLCLELGIERRYRTVDVADPVHWIRHNQTARRNLGEQEMRDLIVETKAKNPEASTRTIAEKLGANPRTVARVLERSGVTGVTPVKGKDGKTYPYRAKLRDKHTAHYAAIFAAWSAGKTVEELCTKFDISAERVTQVIEVEQAKQADFVLSASAQEKFDAKIRAYKRQLDLEAETRAINETKKRVDEWYIPDYMALLRKVERMLEYKRGILTRADYRKIQRCLHPDTGAHVSEASRNEAFRLFTQHEARLVDDQEQDDLKKVSTLPRTVAEMMARKRSKSVRA